jgi:lipopolysaccharide heptosyltransferase II
LGTGNRHCRGFEKFALKQRGNNLSRVVVRGTNWVGDAVMTVPALRQLRQFLPNAHITLAMRPWSKGLFAEADFIDELLVIDQKRLEQIRIWKRHEFDLALLFTNSFESAAVAALARVPFRIGYKTQARGWLLTNAVPLPDWRDSRHEVYYYLNLVTNLARELNLPLKETPPQATLRVSSSAQKEARRILAANGVVGPKPIIALCPGSINSRAKRWPAESFAALADRLSQELEANVLLIGSNDELDVSLTVARKMITDPVMLTGKTDLAQVVAILNEVDLLITNDTGPAHIASALDRPVLVIFGPTNPLTTRPFSETAELIRHPPDCAPCMLRDCPIDHRCMTAITPDGVFERARKLLSTHAGGRVISAAAIEA